MNVHRVKSRDDGATGLHSASANSSKGRMCTFFSSLVLLLGHAVHRRVVLRVRTELPHLREHSLVQHPRNAQPK
jgi:hypothetical protein